MTRQADGSEWTIEPHMLMPLLYNRRFELPDRVWEETDKAKPTKEAIDLARSTASSYFTAQRQAGRKLTGTLDKVVAAAVSNPDWTAGAQIALTLVSRYKRPLAVFARALKLKADHRHAYQRKLDATHLIVACEWARVWQAGGYAAEIAKLRDQSAVFRQPAENSKVAKAIRATGELILRNSAALNMPAAAALAGGRMSGSSRSSPSKKLSGALWQLLPEGCDRHLQHQKLSGAVQALLMVHGVDLRRLDEEHRTPTPSMLDIPTRQAQLIGDLLVTLAKEIASNSSRTISQAQSKTLFRHGNLDLSGNWRTLPVMPTTGLAVELVMLLIELSKKRIGRWAPVPHLENIEKHASKLGYSPMTVAAEFISAVRPIHYTAGAVRQAVLSLLKRKNDVRIREWT